MIEELNIFDGFQSIEILIFTKTPVVPSLTSWLLSSSDMSLVIFGSFCATWYVKGIQACLVRSCLDLELAISSVVFQGHHPGTRDDHALEWSLFLGLVTGQSFENTCMHLHTFTHKHKYTQKDIIHCEFILIFPSQVQDYRFLFTLFYMTFVFPFFHAQDPSFVVTGGDRISYNYPFNCPVFNIYQSPPFYR